MKNLIWVLVAMFSFAGSCKNHGGKVKVDEDFKLLIDHVGCRGFCPAYNMEVDATGKVTYEGRRNVDLMGKYTKEIGVEKVKELIAVLDQYQFETMEDEYGGGVADLPSVVTEVTRGGKTKRVNNIRQAPAEVNEMQKKLEEIIGMDGFSPVPQ